MATAAQRKALDFIIAYQRTTGGVSPTLAEIAAHCGLTTRSGAARTLVCLEERGHIRRLRDRARAIEVLTPRQQRYAVFVWNEQIQQLVPFVGRKRSEAGA